MLKAGGEYSKREVDDNWRCRGGGRPNKRVVAAADVGFALSLYLDNVATPVPAAFAATCIGEVREKTDEAAPSKWPRMEGPS